MKKTFLLLLCSSLATLAFTQRKAEFGFVVKAGNYAFPFKKTTSESYLGTTTSSKTITYNAGETYALGIWQSFRLGKHFRLSGELVYRYASFTSEEDFYQWTWEGSFQTISRLKTQENSLALPLKLHFSFKKEGKASISLGGGFSHIFAANVYVQASTQFFQFQQSTGAFTTRYSKPDAFNTQYNLSAGFHYRLDAKTALGLEYTFEKATHTYLQYPNAGLTPPVDCNCFYNEPRIGPNMNSFSVSLRHNILD